MVNFLYISASRQIWAFDDTTSKVVRFDPQGHLLYAWGSLGDYPGGLFNIHGASVDQEGNLYIAEVANGRMQKFRPRAGANPEFWSGSPCEPPGRRKKSKGKRQSAKGKSSLVGAARRF